jgi:ribosome maturation factor RimP
MGCTGGHGSPSRLIQAGGHGLNHSGIHGKGKDTGKGKGKGAKPGSGASARPVPGRPLRRGAPVAATPFVEPVVRPGWREAIERTVVALNYELVDVERAPRGLLRIYIDRLAGHIYPTGESEFILVEDCELVTRQLQYSLEVDAVDYARLEVSSPGLDRPLRREADYERFCGQAVSLTLKVPFQGRKVYKGELQRAEAGWTLEFSDGKTNQLLAFTLDEVREARLVPVLDFKGRGRGASPAAAQSLAPGAQPDTDKSGDLNR